MRVRHLALLAFAISVGGVSLIWGLTQRTAISDRPSVNVASEPETRDDAARQERDLDPGRLPAVGQFKVDLNRASWEELALLPGIGPGLSQRIVEYRQTCGQFGSMADLLEVPGIGPKRLDEIQPFLMNPSKSDF